MKKTIRLTESDLTRIIKRVIREGEGFKSNKKEDEELDLRNKLNDIFFRQDAGNLFSEPGEFGYLSREHQLGKKISPRQRQERIRQVVSLLKNYIKDLEHEATEADVYLKNPEYKNIWGSIEGDEDLMKENWFSRMFKRDKETEEISPEMIENALNDLAKFEFDIAQNYKGRKKYARLFDERSTDDVIYVDLNKLERGDIFYDYIDSATNYIEENGGSVQVGNYNFTLEGNDIIISKSSELTERYLRRNLKRNYK